MRARPFGGRRGQAPRTGPRLLEQAESRGFFPMGQQLGPVPDDPASAGRLIDRAGTVAAYRRPTARRRARPIGQRPGRVRSTSRQEPDPAYPCVRRAGGPDRVRRAPGRHLRHRRAYERATGRRPRPRSRQPLRRVQRVLLADVEREAVQKYVEGPRGGDGGPGAGGGAAATVEGYDCPWPPACPRTARPWKRCREARQRGTAALRRRGLRRRRHSGRLELRAPEPETEPEPLELQEDVRSHAELELERPETGEKRAPPERAHEPRPTRRADLTGEEAAAGVPSSRRQGDGDPRRLREQNGRWKSRARPPG